MRTFLVGKDGVMSSRYDAETKARAVRLVREHVGDYDSEWAAITAVAGRLGLSAETLRKWIGRPRLMPARRQGCPRTPRRRSASSSGRTPRPATPLICRFIAEHRARFGVVPICR